MCFKTTIGITGVRILGREDFYWKTDEMGIIIHTSYPHPNFCPDFNFPQGQSFCPFQISPSPHVGYADDLLLPFKVSAFATRLTMRILTAPRELGVIGSHYVG
jgi:hypothetical protein